MKHRRHIYSDCRRGATLRRVGRFLAPPLMAIGFVLVGSTDWGLVLPGEVNCAVDAQSCHDAQRAIPLNHLPGVSRDTPSSCVRYPGCRAAKKDYIENYNMPSSAR